MIDEFFERLIDSWCERLPRFFKPRTFLLTSSRLGWRLRLYIGTARNRIGQAVDRVKTDESVNQLVDETAERSQARWERLKGGVRRKIAALGGLERSAQSIRFCAMLFMLMLSALGVVSTRSRQMAVMAASLCTIWISAAIEADYAPIASGIRQRYLAATLTRVAAISLLLLSYFFTYMEKGVSSNVVLQGAMIVTLTVHGMFFTALVLLNTRQPLFLRGLAGVLGAAPALTAAAAIALAASQIVQPWPLPLFGVLSAVGAVMAFAADQLITLIHLGGIRLKFSSIWVTLLEIGGFALMLAGAWSTLS